MSQPIAARRIAIIGVGLIAGSLALALRRAGYNGEIVGCGRREDALRSAVALGVIDRYELHPAAAVVDADLVVLGVPVLATRDVLSAIRDAVSTDAIITDVGSTKASVIADAKAVFGDPPPRLVPGHPIAGTESSGVEAAFAELFDGRLTLLTPTQTTQPSAVREVERLWQCCGARTVCTTAEHHDDVLAATSHLPHMLAFALVDLLAARDDHAEVFRYAAGGFRDFTRIASSSPEMWRDIASANAPAVTANLDALIARLTGLRDAIAADDRDAVVDTFRRAKAARDAYVDLVAHPAETAA